MKKLSAKRRASVPGAIARGLGKSITMSKSKQYKILFSKDYMHQIQYNAARIYLDNKSFITNDHNSKILLAMIGSSIIILALFILRLKLH